MRKVADAERVRALMRALGAAARDLARVYFTGGATAVLLGWRPTTVDVDLRIDPESDSVLRAIPELKERIEINVDLPQRLDSIPELPAWRERSQFIAQEGKLSFYHYDLYSQTLSKVERSHERDVEDVRAMISSGRVDPQVALDLFGRIEARYPAIDPPSFRRKAESMLRKEEAR